MDSEESGRTREGADVAADTYYLLRSIVTVVLAAVLAFTFLFRTVRVVGPSMEGTLQEGDVLIISALGQKPRYGDIVVLLRTAAGWNEDLRAVFAKSRPEQEIFDKSFDLFFVSDRIDGEKSPFIVRRSHEAIFVRVRHPECRRFLVNNRPRLNVFDYRLCSRFVKYCS